MGAISDETLDKDLDEVWAIFIARVSEKSKWNLNTRSTASVDSLLQFIGQDGDVKSDKNEKAKNVWKSTLKCVDRLGVFVQRFGAVAAQAASVVFGPSQQCFNAISFAIEAAQKYKEVFANITVLMERISVFLENLDMYMTNNNAETKLDKRLRKTVYRVLEHFVQILATTHSLTTDWKARMKLKAKSFALGEDEGIKASLGTLETLVSDFTGAQISMIVQDLSEAARNIRGVDKKLDVLSDAAEEQISLLHQAATADGKQTTMLSQLTAADERQTARDQEVKDLEAIKKALSVDESRRPWDRQAELWSTHVEGTGQWLLDRPSFSKWANAKSTATEILTIKAPTGYGKSFLSSVVVHHLQQKHHGDGRVAVLYYYFNRETGEKTGSPLSKAVKTIVWQLANANKEYAGAISKTCESGVDLGSTSNTWKRLIADQSRSVNLTAFIVLDGVSELEKEPGNSFPRIIQQIRSVVKAGLDASSFLNVRLFFTAAPDVLDPIRYTIEPALPEISLEPPTNKDEASPQEGDLALVVEDKINRTERLQKLDEELKQRIKTELSKGARGAYSRLSYPLDDLVNIQNTSQIDDILKRANQSLAEMIESKIAALNSSLTQAEIAEVNVLLQWTAVSYWDLKVDMCEAILALGSGGQPLGLEDRLRKRYTELFSLDEDKCITVREGIKDYLSKAGEVAADGGKAAGTEIGVTREEVTLISKLVSTHLRNVFGDNDAYARFGFENFFDQKRGLQAVKIRLNPEECHLIVAQGCLMAMCDKYKEASVENLLQYSQEWWVDHLWEVDRDKTSSATKQDIGRKSLRLLHEPALIEAWWKKESMSFLTGIFICWDTADMLLKAQYNWFKDPVVVGGMADLPSERDWVQQVTSTDEPSFELYGKIAVIMAKRWLESDDDELSEDSFIWLKGWTSRIRGEDASQYIDASVGLIDEIALWAKSKLPSETKAGMWLVRVAKALRSNECYESAASRYRRAIEARPDDWKVQVDLAETLGLCEQYQGAVAIVEKLINARINTLGEDQAFKDIYYARLLHNLGEWNSKRKEFDAARTAYQKILDHALEQKDFPEFGSKAALGMLSLMNSQSQHVDGVELLDQLSERVDSTGSTWTLILFRRFYDDREFHRQLYRIFKRSNSMRIAAQYEQAIEQTRSVDEPEIHFEIKWHYARLKWCTGEHEFAAELWYQLALNPAVEGSTADMSIFRVRAAEQASSAFLIKAKTAEIPKNGNDKPAQLSLLEELVEVDYDTSWHRASSPRIMLARFFALTERPMAAIDTLRTLMKEILSQIDQTGEMPQKGTLNHGFYRIAMIFGHLGDDRNAVAAWHSYWAPNLSTPSIDGTDGASPDLESASRPNDVGPDSKKSATSTPATLSAGPAIPATDALPEAGPDADIGGIVADSQTKATSSDPIVANGVATDGKASINNDSGDGGTTERDTTTGTLRKLVSGPTCNGPCGHVSFYGTQDYYVCRDCLDTHFCATCYSTLKLGNLDIPECHGSLHSLLLVPRMDQGSFLSARHEYVVLGERTMLRKDWLENLKKEWQVDEESLKAEKRFASAAQRIQKAWKIFKVASMK